MRAYEDWVVLAENKGLKISQVVLLNQIEELEIPEQALLERMGKNLKVMRESVNMGLSGNRRSVSGLVGGTRQKSKPAAKVDLLYSELH